MYIEPLIPLGKFGQRSDKNKAIFFVGRKDIIAGIESTVAEIESRIKSETSDTELQPGMLLSNQDTCLIQGAPGAGKSALLSYLQNRWMARSNGPVVVRVEPVELRNEFEVTQIIANCIVPDYGAEILNFVRTVEGGLVFSMFIKGGGKVTDSEQSSKLVLQDLAKLYSKKAAAVFKRVIKGSSVKPLELRPIVVMIDEV